MLLGDPIMHGQSFHQRHFPQKPLLMGTHKTNPPALPFSNVRPEAARVQEYATAPYTAGCPTCERNKVSAWIRGWDTQSGRHYRWNQLSGDSQWEESKQALQAARPEVSSVTSIEFSEDWACRFFENAKRRQQRARRQHQWLKDNQRVSPAAAAQAAITAKRGRILSTRMMEAMYGCDFSAVQAAEASLNATFDGACDTKDMVLWPVSV